MPAAMTFTSLQVALQAYLERGSPNDVIVAANLPQLINTAERTIARKFKVQGFLTVVVSLLQAGQPMYAKPDRWRRTVSMRYGSGNPNALAAETGSQLITEAGVGMIVSPMGTMNSGIPIYTRSLEYCQRYWPDQTQTGPPKFYADYDYGHWLVVPTPDLTYPWALNYYAQPPLLDNTNQTNWLTSYCPNLLLYRTLLEMTPFLKNDERIPVWKQFYEDELAAVSAEDLQKAADRAAKRNES